MKRSLILIVVVLLLGAGAGLFIASRVSRNLKAEKLSSQLLVAANLVQEGKAVEAAELLEPWRADRPGGEVGERFLLLDMEALDAAGRGLEAMEAAEAYLESYPKRSGCADAEYILLKPLIAADAGDQKVRDSVEDFLEKYPDHPAGVRLQLALARADFERGKKEEVRVRLLSLLESDLAPEERQMTADLLGDVNVAILMTPDPAPGETVIELKQGQYLYDLARKYDVPLQLLMDVNQIKDPRRLRIGQRIRIPAIQFSLVCDKAENTLTLYNNGRYFKEYPVRTGRRADATPTGEFKILNKKTDPTWRSPIDGKTYKPGDPNNELGTRWMAFEGDILGIHGTIHPETVGHYASNGCIGLLKEDVEELFDLIPVGTPLTIVGQQDLTKHQVIESPESREVASTE